MNLQRQTNFSVSSVGVPIRNTADYSPFGVQLDGRTIQGDFYRRGFNGMEKDDEVKGGGNSYTTEFRQYDARVGRWLSLDPLEAKFPDLSPYLSFNNNPILLTDIFGLESKPPKTNVLAIPEGDNSHKELIQNAIDNGIKVLYIKDVQDLNKQIESNNISVGNLFVVHHHSSNSSSQHVFFGNQRVNEKAQSKEFIEVTGKNTSNLLNEEIQKLGQSVKGSIIFLQCNSAVGSGEKSINNKSFLSDIASLTGDKVIAPQFNISEFQENEKKQFFDGTEPTSSLSRLMTNYPITTQNSVNMLFYKHQGVWTIAKPNLKVESIDGLRFKNGYIQKVKSSSETKSVRNFYNKFYGNN